MFESPLPWPGGMREAIESAAPEGVRACETFIKIFEIQSLVAPHIPPGTASCRILSAPWPPNAGPCLYFFSLFCRSKVKPKTTSTKGPPNLKSQPQERPRRAFGSMSSSILAPFLVPFPDFFTNMLFLHKTHPVYTRTRFLRFQPLKIHHF